MIYTKDQLIEALHNEYVFLCHDDFDPDEDPTPEEYLEMIKTLSHDELILETSTGYQVTLEEYMGVWS